MTSLMNSPVEVTVKFVPPTETVRVWLSWLSVGTRSERNRAWSSWATA